MHSAAFAAFQRYLPGNLNDIRRKSPVKTGSGHRNTPFMFPVDSGVMQRMRRVHSILTTLHAGRSTVSGTDIHRARLYTLNRRGGYDPDTARICCGYAPYAGMPAPSSTRGN